MGELTSGPENTYNGPKFYKYNIIQNLTINLQNSTAAFTSERESGTWKEINAYEYSKVSDVVNNITDAIGGIFSSGDNSDKEQYGWRLYGVGTSMGWQNGLPRPKEESDADGIDIAALLQLAAKVGPSSSPAELYNKIVQKWMKHTGNDMKNLLMALNVMAHELEQFAEVTSNIRELNDLSNEKPKKPVSNQNNTAPRLDPGKNKKDDGSVFCRFHKKNFVRKNGTLTTVQTKKPAIDTAESHLE